jgi:hypothetical protein
VVVVVVHEAYTQVVCNNVLAAQVVVVEVLYSAPIYQLQA